MIFTIYERACAVAEIENEELSQVLRQTGLPIVSSEVMKRNINTYLLKISLIKDKQNVLDNVMKNIDDFSTSNTDLISKASEVSLKAITFRQNLELSVLESQLKSLEIESMNIKTMTANEFVEKYGA